MTDLRFETLACFDYRGERIALGEASMAMVRFSRPLTEVEWRSFAECCDAFARASADTHPKGGNSVQHEVPAPLSGAVPNEDSGDAQ